MYYQYYYAYFSHKIIRIGAIPIQCQASRFSYTCILPIIVIQHGHLFVSKFICDNNS